MFFDRNGNYLPPPPFIQFDQNGNMVNEQGEIIAEEPQDNLANIPSNKNTLLTLEEEYRGIFPTH